MQDDRSPEWDKISKALFGQKPEPVSEKFTRNVMKRIEAAESGPRLVRVPTHWLAPAMGVAAMLLLALFPSRTLIAAETMIMGDDTEIAYADGVLGAIMEEK